MIRDLSSLEGQRFQVLVIGGGIVGACAAWDASQRGLSVALIDKADFGGATSANSLKTIHGGLRYLKNADVRRVRQSIVERSILLRIAPHLVRPLGFLVPTYGHGVQGREALAVALQLTDMIGFDRNRGMDESHRLPDSRTIPRTECLGLFDGFEPKGLTGGGIWYDAQAQDTERLTLSFLLSAASRGATMANYVRFDHLCGRIDGGLRVRAEDCLTGAPLEIRASVVLNATGPWADEIVHGMVPAGRRIDVAEPLALAINLVTRPLLKGLAVGAPSKLEADRVPAVGAGRFLFLAPWRRSTLIGTSYRTFTGSADLNGTRHEDVADFVSEVNATFPSLKLTCDDVTLAHRGLMPLSGRRGRRAAMRLADEARLIDHQVEDGVEGLVTAVGVKYTTARQAAQDAIDLVIRKLRRDPRTQERATATIPLYGGETVVDPGVVCDGSGNIVPKRVVERLVAQYGSGFLEVMRGVDHLPQWSEPLSADTDVLRGEVVHAVRHEMAMRLSDVVRRRTGLGSQGRPALDQIHAAAAIMACELDWTEERRQAEIADVLDSYNMLDALQGTPSLVPAIA